jgi:hypothetical protein
MGKFRALIRKALPAGILFILPFLVTEPAISFSTEQARFSIKVKDNICSYREFGVFVLPGETLSLEALNKKDGIRYVLEATGGRLKSLDSNRWNWRAPDEKGLYSIRISTQPPLDSILLNIFVMVPFKELKGEYLNGYRIGRYPRIPANLFPMYRTPKGFIEVTEKNQGTRLSPHFKLKQFVCKEQSGYPKYVVLKEGLLLKLELVLQKVNEKGLHCEAFHIMSGYQTPYYNSIIGNVKYSRHLWGGAADIFIDECPKDGMMDDLNKDGQINWKDAEILYNIVDELYGKPFYTPFIGGLGRYKKALHHGPFVHIDVRGKRARWETD